MAAKKETSTKFRIFKDRTEWTPVKTGVCNNRVLLTLLAVCRDEVRERRSDLLHYGNKSRTWNSAMIFPAIKSGMVDLRV